MKKLIKSFGFAFRGLLTGIKSERNMKIHLAAVVVVIVAGVLGGIEPWAWAVLLLCIGLVISSELINTALEYLCNRVAGNNHEDIIKNVKDMAAAAVLVAAMISVAVAAVVFCRAEVLSRLLSLF